MRLIGVGIDLVEVDRMRAALDRTRGFRARVFTEGERTDLEARADPVEGYAARFAAKEAVLKAMGVGLWSCRLTDIEVRRAENGAPSVQLSGGALDLAVDRGVIAWQLSLSHTATTAGAVAIAVGDDNWGSAE